MERTLKNLRRAKKGDVYVWLRNAQVGKRFLQDAEREGFTIGADHPTAHPPATVMALRDGTIHYVGANGMIRFGCGDARGFCRVDYEKYISGAKDYRCGKSACSL